MLALVSLVSTFSLIAPGSGATTLARMDLRALTQQSAYILRARCVNAISLADSSMVWTVTTFEVSEAWKGNPPPRFTVRLPGGEAGGERVTVEGAPRFAAGEEAVLFLAAGRGRQMQLVSWAQGTFRIRKNARTGVAEAIQDTAGLQVLDARTGAQSRGGRRSMPLAALRAQVSQAIREAAR